MKKLFWLVVLTVTLMTRGFAADAEKKVDTTKSESPTITARAPTGESVLLIERTSPKVVGIIPPGWKVVPLEEAKINSDPIEIHTGLSSVISLSPYKLVPDPKLAPFAFKEPGFDPTLGIHQTNTVGAILSNYIREEQKLDEKLGSVIDQIRTVLNQPAGTPSETARQIIQLQRN
ncbi:MAG TPA: hypothetical protein VFO40_06210 [Chthoniobacterales bacterium]|nr:hypothetical protein [Chthoniobacterales bacterium]